MELQWLRTSSETPAKYATLTLFLLYIFWLMSSASNLPIHQISFSPVFSRLSSHLLRRKFVLLHLSLAEAGSHTNRLNRFVGYVGFILGWPGSAWPMASIWCSDCCRNPGGNAAAAVSSRGLLKLIFVYFLCHESDNMTTLCSRFELRKLSLAGLIFRKRWFLQPPYLILYKIESLCPYKIGKMGVYFIRKKIG